MPEDNKQDKPDDVDKDDVKRDDYNKVVEAHNSLKIEKEKLENELTELKEKKESEEKEKKEWEKKTEELENQIKEIKEKANKDNVVRKGVINQEKERTEYTQEKAKELLDNSIPTEGIGYSKTYNTRVDNLSPIQRYGYYKAPTQLFSKESLGRALSLHNNAQQLNKNLVPNNARANKQDIIL